MKSHHTFIFNYFFLFFYIMQKIALINFVYNVYIPKPTCVMVQCCFLLEHEKSVLYKSSTRKSYFCVTSAFFTDNCTCPWHDPHVYVLEHVQLKQPDQGHHTLFISNRVCLQIAARANVFWLFFFHPLHRCTTDLWVFFIKLARLYWYIYSHAVLIN